MKPLVSVIIPTYNGAKFIDDAVRSALSQTYPNVEVIVVDDGSSDGTKEVLSPYGSKIKYIYQENKGVSAARNNGIRNASGEFVAFLDSDDAWLPEKIELQVAEMLKSPQCGLVSCGFYLCDEELKEVSQGSKPSYPNKNEFMVAMLFGNQVGGGSCALIRKDCFQKSGLFNEKLQGTEDWEMWFRLVKYYEMRFVDKPLIRIRVVSDSMSSAGNAEKMLKNEMLVLREFFSGYPYRTSIFLKGRVFSRRYLSAAWALIECGEKTKARKSMLKAIFLDPPGFFTKATFALFLRVFFGKR